MFYWEYVDWVVWCFDDVFDVVGDEIDVFFFGDVVFGFDVFVGGVGGCVLFYCFF